MSADPRNSKVGDRFIRNDAPWAGDWALAVREVTAVGRSRVLYVHADGEEFHASLAYVAENWIAVPEPLITEPITLRQLHGGNGSYWQGSVGGGRSALARLAVEAVITIMPDHTWIEGPPPLRMKS